MHPKARISIFVDDATVSAEDDDAAACVATVVAAAGQLAAVVENELGGTWQLRRRQLSEVPPRCLTACASGWANTRGGGAEEPYP